MLLSELEERERRFKLALRAGIPVVAFSALVFYALFLSESKTVTFTFFEIAVFTAIVFAVVYFNFFFIELSIKDSLVDQTTQSFNQRGFMRKLSKYRPKAIVLLRLKNIATLNDHFPSAMIDEALQILIQRLDKYLKQNGYHDTLIARFYGAEFLIAFSSPSDSMKTLFERFIQENSTVNTITFDIAFAAATDTGEKIDDIVSSLRALIGNDHCNSSKRPNVVKKAKQIHDNEERIKEALKSRKLRLSFRPIQDVKTASTYIYEVVCKIVDGEGNEIPPRDYLPVVNRLGLGREYDAVLSEHIARTASCVNEKIFFTFNLSPFSIRNEAFREIFFSLFSSYDISPSRFYIQLYERKAYHDLRSYFQNLLVFQSKGVGICIDNFGSSNASFEYIKHFSFDMVQFDREFVSRIDDVKSVAMLSSLIEMAKSLEIKTVAKWVDNEKKKRRLIQMGIDYVQGFSVGAPLSKEELEKKHPKES